jgi:hypothetical protein
VCCAAVVRVASAASHQRLNRCSCAHQCDCDTCATMFVCRVARVQSNARYLVDG